MRVTEKIQLGKCSLIHLGKNNQRLSCSAGGRYLESTRNEKKTPRDSSGKPIRRGLVLALKSMILGLHTEAKTLSSREVMIQLYVAQVEQYLWLWRISARLTCTNWREFRQKCH